VRNRFCPGDSEHSHLEDIHAKQTISYASDRRPVSLVFDQHASIFSHSRLSVPIEFIDTLQYMSDPRNKAVEPLCPHSIPLFHKIGVFDCLHDIYGHSGLAYMVGIMDIG
jgi:hypothetical protein